MTSQSASKMLTEIIPPRILPKVYKTLDLAIIYIAIIMFIPNASGIPAGFGASTMTWWVIGFLTFLIPGALVVGELGLMFPEEGSVYVWSTKAFGEFWGFVGGWFAWISGLIVIALTAVLTLAYLPIALGITFDFTTSTVVGLIVIWGSTAIALRRARISQSYANVSAIVYMIVVALIGLGGVLFLLRGNAPANSLDAASLAPNFGTLGGFSFVILALLGVEIPLNMGVEVAERKAITKHLLYGSVILMGLYLWATFGVLVSVPSIDATRGIVDAVGAGFGPIVASVVALVVAAWFFVNTTIYNYSYARLMFVNGIEKRLPVFMAHINKKSKIPDVAILLQGAAGTIMMLIIQFALGGGAATEYVVLSAAITIVWSFSMLFLFASLIWARKNFPERAREVHVIPGGSAGRWLIMGIGLIATIFAIIFTFYAPWTSSLSTTDWNVAMAELYVPLIVLGVIVYFTSQRRVKAITLEKELELLEVEKLEKGPG